MRALLPALLLLSTAASAQEILEARGDTLGQFRVLAHLDRLDRSSPMAFAKGWARLHEQEQAVARRFHELFEGAHVALLDRFYGEELVALQKKLYEEKVRDVNDLRCKVLEEKAGPHGRQLVYVRRSWIDAIDRPVEDRAQLMFRKEKDGTWRLVEVRYEVRPGSFERRDRTIPPVTARRRVPEEFEKFEPTPAGTFGRLRLEFRKLSWERGNAQHELIRHFFPITRELYGPAVEKEARENQPAAKPRDQFWFREKEPETLDDGAVRLTIMALEKAPGQDAAMVAGEAVFVMREDGEGRWRVVEELLKTDPEKPAEPVRKKIGLFLMG